MRVSRMLALFVFVASGGAALAQEKVENPMFTNWAKHKVGTTVTLKSTTASAAFNSESSTTTKLLEVTADKVVLELVTTSKVNGMEFKSPPMKLEHAKSIELPKGVKKEDFAKRPEGTTKEGTETIKVGAGEFKAKWYELELKTGGTDVKTKMWMSDEVPGTILKSESQIGGATALTTKMELTEFKKP